MSAALLMLAMGGAPGVINGSLVAGSAESTAQFFLGNDGAYSAPDGSANWLTPALAAFAALYQVMVTVTSGGFAAGSADTATWLDMDSSRTWFCQDGVAASATFTVSFREKASQLVRSVQSGLVLTATSP